MSSELRSTEIYNMVNLNVIQLKEKKSGLKARGLTCPLMAVDPWWSLVKGSSFFILGKPVLRLFRVSYEGDSYQERALRSFRRACHKEARLGKTLGSYESP